MIICNMIPDDVVGEIGEEHVQGRSMSVKTE